MAVEKPKEVKIGPHDYKIYWTQADWNKYANIKKKSSDFHYGKTQHVYNRILINSDMALSVQKETLLHELMHACFAVTNTSALPHKTDSNDDTEEVYICILSPLLFQVFIENPDVVDWLLS